MRVPHPIPYQGSKRRLAPQILAVLGARRFHTLYEPFAGSAAVTLAAAAAGVADRYVLADTLPALAELWAGMLADAPGLADAYAAIWRAQQGDPAGHYARVRDRFNAEGGAARLLYLLARCVKNAPRFNRAGAFNQGADHRRAGMRPEAMRDHIQGAARLLGGGRATVRCADFQDVLAAATPADLVYLDPPWQGTSAGADTRYHAWPTRERLVAAVCDLRARGVPYLLSYDGRHGAKTYGPPLAEAVGATRLELNAGRSSQATLSGRAVTTYESLYVAL